MPKDLLTYAAIQGLKPKKDKKYKKFDGGGLFIEIMPNGSKLWRFKYTYNKKEKLLSFGKYPDITLKEARQKRDEAKKLLIENIDPSSIRKNEVKKEEIRKLQAESTLEKIFNEWFDKKKNIWSERHAITLKQRFLRNAEPLLKKGIAEIEPTDLMACLKIIEDRGNYETAKRTLQIINQVFAYAIIKGICKYSPGFNLHGFLTPHKARPMPAIIEPEKIRILLKDIEKYPASLTVKNALLLTMYIFIRPGEIIKLKWEYVNWEDKILDLPAHIMKNKLPHIVPLSKTALNILKEQQLLSGEYEHIFPGIRDKTRQMSNNTMNKALGTIGYERGQVVVHGFRTTASTNLHAAQKFDSAIIERQLSHVDNNKVRSAYNRYDYFKERVELMKWYGEFLDNLRK
ncbi:MAG: tyrosine-type recombinase/integrase [bacterium]